MRKYLKEGQYSIDESDVLGKGSFGKVYRGYDHTNSRWVAIKSINLELLQIHGTEMKTIICNEITVMRKFTKQMQEKPCPFLVKHFDCFRTDTNVYIVMELCEGGTLNDAIQKGQLPESTVVIILKQVAQGLEYLDGLNICHRDLKPQNIFVANEFNNGKNQVFYKIGDFGFAAQKQTFNQVLGTYPFMAPQIFKRENYTSKVDVWSMGVIAYQLLFAQLYFFGKNKWQIQQKVKQVPFVLPSNKSGKISSEMEQLISLCLLKDQEKRPRITELLKCKLFMNIQKSLAVIFDALQHELMFSEFLRSMAEQICQFGRKKNRKTEFIQMYFLKKAYSIINLLTYSIMNKQNYLNIESEMFQLLNSEKYSAKYSEISDKIQKQNILITDIFTTKHKLFTSYIAQFSQEERESINEVIAADKLYGDINPKIFRSELDKWIKVIQPYTQFEELKLKCQKLHQL